MTAAPPAPSSSSSPPAPRLRLQLPPSPYHLQLSSAPPGPAPGAPPTGSVLTLRRRRRRCCPGRRPAPTDASTPPWHQRFPKAATVSDGSRPLNQWMHPAPLSCRTSLVTRSQSWRMTARTLATHAATTDCDEAGTPRSRRLLRAAQIWLSSTSRSSVHSSQAAGSLGAHLVASSASSSYASRGGRLSGSSRPHRSSSQSTAAVTAGHSSSMWL